MPRLVVLGGFLGSGKTTTLLRLAREIRSRGWTVGVVANDQGEELVDTALFRAAGLDTLDVRGGCFCCRLDDFLARADELARTFAPDYLLAEPVGSCTDLVATVMRPLQQLHPGAFDIAPYVVLVDPLRARDALSPRGSAKLSEKVTYVYRLQQMEADTIAINKVDALSADERAEVRALLAARFPGKRIVEFSAHTGEGFDELATLVLDAAGGELPASPAIDYDRYAEGEAELAWFDGRYACEADEPIDVDRALLDVTERLRHALTAAGHEIAHLKLVAEDADRVAAASVARGDAPPGLVRATDALASAFALVVNARVAAMPGELAAIAQRSIAKWAEEQGADLREQRAELFSPARPIPTTRIT